MEYRRSFMTRRRLIALVGGVAGYVILWPPSARAQSTGKIPRIGVLWAQGDMDLFLFDALRQGLGQLGYIDGKTVNLEHRFVGERYDRLDALVAELVESRVDVLVADATANAAAARRATKTIPIVFVFVGDPVGSKLVDSLSHPGGNATGLSGMTLDVAAKEVEIFKEGLPNVSRLAILQNPNYTFSTRIAQAMKNAAGRLQLTVDLFEAHTANDLDRTLREIAQRRPDGLLITAAPMFVDERKRIAELALANHLPTMTWLNENTRSGLLMSYGTNVADLFRRAAFYVDKILRGAKPADLPVEQPTKFELVINLRTAKALGLTIPPSLLARADEVIE
jgi:putative tryptophan/tyrosine transport system substrate-binding protein